MALSAIAEGTAEWRRWGQTGRLPTNGAFPKIFDMSPPSVARQLIIGARVLISIFDSKGTSMRTVVRLSTIAAITLFATNLLYAQESSDTNRKIAGGGITVPGWQGKVDPDAEKAGQSLNDATTDFARREMNCERYPLTTF